ncbi:MAG TPA: tetratricopeptide repeat protein [Thermoguttaceae bacterium]|nr:tetratricopeptide repeat protein [Thermoguttaceae bacterium]
MRLSAAILASAALFAAAASSNVPSDKPNDDHRRSMGNLRPNDRTAGLAVQGSPPPGFNQDRGPADRGASQDRGGDLPGAQHAPYRGDGYRHPHHVGDYGLDPYYHTPRRRYWRLPYLPLIHIPAEHLYGPQALKRFLGLSPTYPAPASPRAILVAGGDENGEEPARRATNQRALDLGRRFLGFGDAHFADGKYAEAYSRYKKAADAAPTLADAYFRQGFALVALGNYQQAAKVLKRGLEIAPDWPRSGFRIHEFYGNDAAAKTAHLGALSQAVVDQPHDADLPFVLGVLVHSGGEPDRAVPLFERAARLTVGSDAHLRAFLDLGRPGQP